MRATHWLLCAALVLAGTTLAAAAMPPAEGEASSNNEDPPPKPLWPLDATDYALLAVILFSLSLAGGAGIGGGAILVPVFIMLRGWPTATAVALSNVTILGGSAANFICNVGRYRPDGRRVIDWSLILLMEPTTIAGALLGAMLNKLLPEWLTTYLLAAMLSFMTLRLWKKGCEAYRKETALLEAAKAAARAARSGSGTKEAGSFAVPAASAKERSRQLGSPGSPAGSDDTAPRRGRGDQDSASQQRDAPATARLPPAARGHRARSSSSALEALSRSLSRSFSRSQRGVLVGEPQRGGALGRSDAVPPGSTLSPLREPLLLPSSPLEAGPAWVQADAQVVSAAAASGLFQGDTLGDPLEPLVVLLPGDELSSSDSSQHASGLLPGADADVEAGSRATAAAADTSSAGRDQGGADRLDDDPHRPLLDGGEPAWGSGAPPTPRTPAGAPEQQQQQRPRKQRCLPLPHFVTLLGLSAWVVASDILQDSWPCGSAASNAIKASVLLPIAVIVLVYRRALLRQHGHDALPPDAVLPEGQLRYTSRTTLLYPALCTSAGVVAGLFGVGGGVVKGPIMLELGVPPDVAAATSATMIAFTASSACLVYARFGHLLPDYAVALLVIGFATTLGSQLLTFHLVRLLGRRSIIVLSMSALMAAASLVIYAQAGVVTQEVILHPEELWRWGHLCPPAAGPAQGSVLGAAAQQLLLVLRAQP